MLRTGRSTSAIVPENSGQTQVMENSERDDVIPCAGVTLNSMMLNYSK
jgi:hypothetical protein